MQTNHFKIPETLKIAQKETRSRFVYEQIIIFPNPIATASQMTSKIIQQDFILFKFIWNMKKISSVLLLATKFAIFPKELLLTWRERFLKFEKLAKILPYFMSKLQGLLPSLIPFSSFFPSFPFLSVKLENNFLSGANCVSWKLVTYWKRRTLYTIGSKRGWKENNVSWPCTHIGYSILK